MKIFYISPNLGIHSTGGTLVGKSNLRMIQTLFEHDVTAYAVNREPMTDVSALDATSSKAGTAWANFHGLCATLSARGYWQFINEIRVHQPDLVWLDTSLFGRLIPEIRKNAPKTKIVTYFHNVEIDLLTRRLGAGALHYIPAWIATCSNERLSAVYSDAVISITQSDGFRISQLYGRALVHTIPISLQPSHKATPYRYDSNTVLFVGSDFGPNIEGLKFLNFEVAPLLKSKRILVVGRGLRRHLAARTHPRIEFLDFVDDLSEVYASSKASLAPIFSGGGMKVKIAESLMNNRPVISTNFAAIGYEHASKNSIFCVDSPVGFSNAIEEWLPSENSRPLDDFNKYYSMDANLKSLSRIVFNVFAI